MLIAHRIHIGDVVGAAFRDDPVFCRFHIRKLRAVAAGEVQATRLFYGCQSLTGESPYTLINGEKVHLYERQNHPTEFLEITSHTSAFNNCTNLTDYESIPSNWK